MLKLPLLICWNGKEVPSFCCFFDAFENRSCTGNCGHSVCLSCLKKTPDLNCPICQMKDGFLERNFRELTLTLETRRSVDENCVKMLEDWLKFDDKVLESGYCMQCLSSSSSLMLCVTRSSSTSSQEDIAKDPRTILRILTSLRCQDCLQDHKNHHHLSLPDFQIPGPQIKLITIDVICTVLERNLDARYQNSYFSVYSEFLDLSKRFQQSVRVCKSLGQQEEMLPGCQKMIQSILELYQKCLEGEKWSEQQPAEVPQVQRSQPKGPLKQWELFTSIACWNGPGSTFCCIFDDNFSKPYVISCGHSICATCVSKVKTGQCPICMHSFTPANCKVNYQARDIITEFKKDAFEVFRQWLNWSNTINTATCFSCKTETSNIRICTECPQTIDWDIRRDSENGPKIFGLARISGAQLLHYLRCADCIHDSEHANHQTIRVAEVEYIKQRIREATGQVALGLLKAVLTLHDWKCFLRQKRLKRTVNKLTEDVMKFVEASGSLDSLQFEITELLDSLQFQWTIYQINGAYWNCKCTQDHRNSTCISWDCNCPLPHTKKQRSRTDNESKLKNQITKLFSFFNPGISTTGSTTSSKEPCKQTSKEANRLADYCLMEKIGGCPEEFWKEEDFTEVFKNLWGEL